MTEVIPAILVENFAELKEKLTRYVPVSKIVQIDMCDGIFVPEITWPMHKEDERSVKNILNEKEGMPFWDRVDFEFDLMVKNARNQFEFFVRLGAKRLVFHYEAEDSKDEFKEFIGGIDMYVRENIEIGIAINTTTSIEEIKTLISNIDFIQCMGIEKIGSQGQKFDKRVLSQITSLRQKYPELIISVDGSVNKNTANILVEAGANRLVIGSTLNESLNLKKTIQYFELL